MLRCRSLSQCSGRLAKVPHDDPHDDCSLTFECRSPGRCPDAAASPDPPPTPGPDPTPPPLPLGRAGAEAAAAPVPFPPDAKIAFVNLQLVVNESKLGKAGQRRAEEARRRSRRQLQAMEKEIRDAAKTKLKTQGSLMSADARTDVQTRSATLTRKLQFEGESAQQEIQRHADGDLLNELPGQGAADHRGDSQGTRPARDLRRSEDDPGGWRSSRSTRVSTCRRKSSSGSTRDRRRPRSDGRATRMHILPVLERLTLPLSVGARRRRAPITSPAAASSRSRTSPSTKSSFRGTFPARR